MQAKSGSVLLNSVPKESVLGMILLEVGEGEGIGAVMHQEKEFPEGLNLFPSERYSPAARRTQHSTYDLRGGVFEFGKLLLEFVHVPSISCISVQISNSIHLADVPCVQNTSGKVIEQDLA